MAKVRNIFSSCTRSVVLDIIQTQPLRQQNKNALPRNYEVTK